ncbi:hypothetical protein I6N96_12545 [Enterococcus sp. BWM-S5]|uniref:Uncharacterized protein n=1 Tax=Enterococcus larvae TaxID=2794352 RepID=A0ABS4CKH0_9ENTE|nr:hypothetical protein [Enterococcus larvae]MBP1047102.1 hypothetical protein [Enterococcus larvae]
MGEQELYNLAINLKSKVTMESARRAEDEDKVQWLVEEIADNMILLSRLIGERE